MNRSEKEKHKFHTAARDLGCYSKDIAAEIGVDPFSLARALGSQRGPVSQSRRRALCRRGLMVQAMLRGWTEDEVWKLNEHEIFGLPEPDRLAVMDEVRQHLAEYRTRQREREASGQKTA